MLPIRHRRSCVGNSRDECRRHRKRPLQVPQSPESGTIPTTAVAHGAPHFRGFADRHAQRQRVLGWKNGTSPAGCREKGRTMITFRRLMGAPKSMGGATEPSLVGIAVGLKVAEERLAALAPHTRLTDPYVRELREIRRLMAPLRANGRGIPQGPVAGERYRDMRMRTLVSGCHPGIP
jgi:hypothetical protein